MNEQGTQQVTTRSRRFLWVTAFSAVIVLLSTALTSACGTVKSTTAYQMTTTAVPSTTLAPSTSIANTSVLPPVTTSATTPNPINTGSGDKFTVPWAKPAGTSLPYLTFYNSLKYTNDWLWVKQESPDTVRIGFTDYAQLAVGNFWSVGFSKVGTVLKRGDTFGFIQGEDTMDVNLQAPVAGTILSINQAVLSDYFLINWYPYDAGWLVEIKTSNPDDMDLLLTAAQYARQCCPPCHCNN